MTSNKVELKAFGLNSQKNITLPPYAVVSGSKSKIFKFLAQKVSPHRPKAEGEPCGGGQKGVKMNFWEKCENVMFLHSLRLSFMPKIRKIYRTVLRENLVRETERERQRERETDPNIRVLRTLSLSRPTNKSTVTAYFMVVDLLLTFSPLTTFLTNDNYRIFDTLS